jgi:lysophospholipase L1-like esterase
VIIMRILKWIGTALGLAALVVPALIGFVWFQGTRVQSGPAEYVALGSSFASGPGVTEHAEGSPALCGRSKDNYPHLLAKARKLALIDVSCGGATTDHVLKGGQYFQRAQIEAITPETKLVTITIGGNNVGYMSNMMAAACANAPELVPRFWKAMGVCKPMSSIEVERKYATLEPSLIEIVRTARQKAPKARIIFLSYQTVVPPAGTCAALHMKEAQAESARAMANRLIETDRQIAASQGIELYDVAALTADHGVCAKDPWIEGVVYPATPFNNGPMIFHTKLKGMQAIAAGLNQYLDRPIS